MIFVDAVTTLDEWFMSYFEISQKLCEATFFNKITIASFDFKLY